MYRACKVSDDVAEVFFGSQTLGCRIEHRVPLAGLSV